MKRIFASLAIAACLAAPATAGALNDAIVDPEIIIETATASSSSSGVGVILLLTTVILAAVLD